MNFAARLIDARERSNFSKSGFARAVGVSPTCVWNWEEGNTRPRPDALMKICQLLNVSREYLLEGSTDRPQGHAAAGQAEEQNAPTLDGTILRAREEIAALAKVAVHQVRVQIEYAG